MADEEQKGTRFAAFDRKALNRFALNHGIENQAIGALKVYAVGIFDEFELHHLRSFTHGIHHF